MQDKNKIISDLQNCISTFLDQLSAEREYLLAGNADDLTKITQEKQESISLLTSLKIQAHPYLQQLKTSANMENNHIVKEEWQNLTKQLNKCQKMNAENNALLNTRLKHATNTLNQLHSLFDTTHSVIYTEDGNEQHSSEPKRSIHA